MAEKNYVGQGDSLETATKSLYDAAKAGGATEKTVGPIEYKVNVKKGKKTFEGEVDVDYGKAFATALENAGIAASKYKGTPEVFATGLFVLVEKQQPVVAATKGKPSGAGPLKKSAERLTDLF